MTRIEDDELFSQAYIAMRDAMSVIDANEGPGFKHSRILNALADARVKIENRRAAMTSAPQDQQAEAVRLRAHIEKMQDYVREYLEPITYVQKHGDRQGRRLEEPMNRTANIAQEMRDDMAKAVLNDLIHMLDGPEERAALAHPAQEARNV